MTKLRLQAQANQETIDHNRRTEEIQRAYNDEQLRISQSQLEELRRSNAANEAIKAKSNEIAEFQAQTSATKSQADIENARALTQISQQNADSTRMSAESDKAYKDSMLEYEDRKVSTTEAKQVLDSMVASWNKDIANERNAIERAKNEIQKEKNESDRALKSRELDRLEREFNLGVEKLKENIRQFNVNMKEQKFNNRVDAINTSIRTLTDASSRIHSVVQDARSNALKLAELGLKYGKIDNE